MTQIQETPDNKPLETPSGKVPLDYLLWLRGTKNRELAAKTGIDESKISYLRRGLAPSKEHADKITETLEVTHEELGWETQADD